MWGYGSVGDIDHQIIRNTTTTTMGYRTGSTWFQYEETIRDCNLSYLNHDYSSISECRYRIWDSVIHPLQSKDAEAAPPTKRQRVASKKASKDSITERIEEDTTRKFLHDLELEIHNAVG
jgi:hypothetical protein